MRIDSMDASTFSPVEYSKPAEPIMKEQVQVQVAVKPKDANEPKNFAHLTDYQKRDLPVSERVVIDAIDRVNRAISGSNRKLEISVHEKTKELIIKVVDSDTNQVVREIPPEKILDMVAKMMEMAGIMVDERR